MGASSFEDFGTHVETQINNLFHHHSSEPLTLKIDPLEQRRSNDASVQSYGFPSADLLLASSQPGAVKGDHYLQDQEGRITNFQYGDQDGQKGHDYSLSYGRGGNVETINDRTSNQTWIATGDGNWSADGGQTEHHFGTVTADKNGLHVTDDASALQIPGMADVRRKDEMHDTTIQDARGDLSHKNEYGQVDEFKASVDEGSFKFNYDAKGNLSEIETPEGTTWTHNMRGWTSEGVRGFIPAQITVDQDGFHGAPDKISQDFVDQLNDDIMNNMQDAPEPENLRK